MSMRLDLRRFEDYDVDLDVDAFTGTFKDFNKLDPKWQAVLSAATNRTADVTIEGRAYKLVALDCAGNFKFERG